MTKAPSPALALALGLLLALAVHASPGVAADEPKAAAEQSIQEEPSIPSQSWSFTGAFGSFDNAQLQRGYQVYKEVCSNCHSMRLLSYRNLGESGGPQFPSDAVDALAGQVQVTDGPNDKGEMYQRPGRPSDRFRSPFPNPEAARAANNGALPPDLSVIAKARPGGPDYIYALLTGYRQTPPGFELAPGMHYNIAFPGHQIAMPPAAERRHRQLYGRHQADARQLCEGRLRLSDVGGGAKARGAASARRPSDVLPPRLCRDHVPGQARNLGAPAL